MEKVCFLVGVLKWKKCENQRWVVKESGGVSLFWVCTFAVIHHYHASEYHQRCQHLLPCQAVHADTDADHNGDDGLHIRVHADQRRTDTFLSYRNEKIGDECGAHDEESQFG